MATKTVRVLSTVTGQVATIPEHLFTNPLYNKNLVLAEEGQKPFVPELYVAKSVGAFEEAHPVKKRAHKDKEIPDSVPERAPESTEE